MLGGRRRWCSANIPGSCQSICKIPGNYDRCQCYRQRRSGSILKEMGRKYPTRGKIETLFEQGLPAIRRTTVTTTYLSNVDKTASWILDQTHVVSHCQKEEGLIWWEKVIVGKVCVGLCDDCSHMPFTHFVPDAEGISALSKSVATPSMKLKNCPYFGGFPYVWHFTTYSTFNIHRRFIYIFDKVIYI